MNKSLVTRLSIYLRLAAATAKAGQMNELADWLLATAAAIERKFSDIFVR